MFNNTTHILLADTTTPQLSGRLTMTIVDSSSATLRFSDVTTLGVTARLGKYGAAITGTGFTVTALAEVEDSTTLMWTPYMDYYDAAPTPVAGGTATVSFGGSFYDK